MRLPKTFRPSASLTEITDIRDKKIDKREEKKEERKVLREETEEELEELSPLQSIPLINISPSEKPLLSTLSIFKIHPWTMLITCSLSEMELIAESLMLSPTFKLISLLSIMIAHMLIKMEFLVFYMHLRSLKLIMTGTEFLKFTLMTLFLQLTWEPKWPLCCTEYTKRTSISTMEKTALGIMFGSLTQVEMKETLFGTTWLDIHGALLPIKTHLEMLLLWELEKTAHIIKSHLSMRRSKSRSRREPLSLLEHLKVHLEIFIMDMISGLKVQLLKSAHATLAQETLQLLCARIDQDKLRPLRNVLTLSMETISAFGEQEMRSQIMIFANNSL